MDSDVVTLRHRRRLELAERLRDLREDLYGQDGAHYLATALDIPLATWLNYEAGVTIPAEIVLKLQVDFDASALWLLTGEGDRYHRT